MKIRLDAIEFNHNSDLSQTGAFHLRRNETQTVTVPEWRLDSCNSYECSPVAYRTLEMPARMTIKASFTCEGEFRGQPTVRAKAKPSHILGDVPKHAILSGSIKLDLPYARVAQAPTGIHDIVWRWEFSATPHLPRSWTEFQTTRHRVYLVPAMPKRPWQPEDPSSDHCSWTDLLNYACDWAAGAMTSDQGAAQITRRVFGLGATLLQFDVVGNGGSHYCDRLFFDCDAFLRRLSGEFSYGPFVNCSDCASIVSTFANAIGADLNQGMVVPKQGKSFDLDPHLLIGLPGWHDGGFRYHEVGWKGKCQEGDRVFDGCCAIDGDDDPGILRALIPADLAFGFPGESGYRHFLAKDAKDDTCVPAVGHCTRRGLGSIPSGKDFTTKSFPGGEDSLSQLLVDSPIESASFFVSGFFFASTVLAGSKLEIAHRIISDGEVRVTRTFWKMFDDFDARLRVDVYECVSTAQAARVLLALIDDFQLPGVEEVWKTDHTINAFTNANRSVFVLSFANVVMRARIISAKHYPDPIVLQQLIGSILESSFYEPQEISLTGNTFYFESNQVRAGTGEPLRTNNAEADEYCQYRFFTPLGEVFRQEGQLVYRPEQVGDHQIRVTRLELTGEFCAQTLSVEVI